MDHRSGWLRVLFHTLVAFVATPSAALQASDPAAWVVRTNFEFGEVGSYAYPDGGDAPHRAFDERVADGRYGRADTRITDAERFGGRQSAEISVRAGQDNLGGRVYLPSPLREGDEIWIRLHVKWQASPRFDFSAAPYLKFLRLKPRLPDESDSYDNDILIDHPDGLHSAFLWSVSHPRGGNVEAGLPGADDPKPGVWETYELYQAFDDATAAEGGRSRTRLWKNGRLLLDSGTYATLKSRDHEVRFLEIVGYWNGGAPRTQSFWVDNIRIQNFAPLRVDDFGNPYLGMPGRFRPQAH
jgi:hypothetical protein